MKKLRLFCAVLLTGGLFSCSKTRSDSSSSFVSSEQSSGEEYGKVDISVPKDIDYDTDPKSPYTIYPTPHNIHYEKSVYRIPRIVEATIESGIDEATEDYLYEVMALKDVMVRKSESATEGYRVLLGIDQSGEAVDRFVNENQSALFEKTDAYYLSIDEKNIVILGKDTDACFYGLTTLKGIFEQTTNVVRCLEVEDYSDCTYRGFIEGYYGIPWTKDERIELMEYGSKVKSNIYIYAPKDDSYHSTDWRSLYNESDLLDLKEEIETGRRTKTRFAWAIHPFLSSAITDDNYTESVVVIKNKFEQLYETGVRQFVISADDVSVDETKKVNAALQKNLLNEMSSWCKSKGDCYDLIFVPSAYCYQSETRLNIYLEPYYEELCDGLDQDVEIMWTGNSICSSVSTGKWEEFTALTGKKAFMWLNWPVNDYSVKHLMMGKGEVLNQKISYDQEIGFTGIVTNPMQQAEESKLSIFAVSDYCWNINGFDCDASYAYSFKTIESNESESLYRLCRHLTNATLYEGRYFDESEEFKPLVENFEEKFYAGDVSGISSLIPLYQEIVSDADSFLNNAENLALRDSMRPWIEYLKRMALASEFYLKVIENSLSPDSMTWFETAERYFAEMEEQKAPVLNTILYNIDYVSVEGGVSVLKPFLNLIRAIAKDEAYLAAGKYLGVTYKGFTGVYEGDLNNVIDEDTDTYVWMDGYPEENAYVRVDLGEITEIKDIRILQGNGKNNDKMSGVIEVSTDGKNFTEVGTIDGLETIVDLRENPVSGRFVRIRSTEKGATWVAIRDISVNQLGELHGTASYEGFDTIYSGTMNNVVDGDDETFVWFGSAPTTDSAITVDLKTVQVIDNIQILTGNSTGSDTFDAVVSVSENGVDYTEVGKIYYGTTSSNLYLQNLGQEYTGRYIRLSSLDSGGTWVALKEIRVNTLESLSKSITCGNLTFYTAESSVNNMIDDDLNSYAWFKSYTEGSYLLLDLLEVKEINTITLYMGNDNSPNDYFPHYEILTSENGTDYVSRGTFTDKELTLTLDTTIDARYVKMVVSDFETSNWVVVREFSAS